MGEQLSKVLRNFTAPTKIEILRLLFDYEDGLSRRELHKLIDRDYGRIDHCLSELRRLGVVDKEQRLGRYFLTNSGRKIFLAIKYIEECVYNAKNKTGKMGKSPKNPPKRKSR